MSVLVRRAGRRDLSELQTLWERLREIETKADSRLALAKGADRLVAEHREVILADPRSAFFVAEDHGDLIGYLHAQIAPNDPIYARERYGTIVDLYVNADRRRQGVGSQLLGFCIEWFQGQNLAEYRVASSVHNPAAQRFFEHHGALPLTVVLTSGISAS